MSEYITIIESHKPSVVCKKYTLLPDGTLKKDVIASVTEGIGASRHVPDVYALADVLRDVTESTNLVLCNGVWHNAGDKPFGVMPEETLARLMSSRVGEVPGGVLEKDGYRVSARLKRGIDASVYLLLDADNPPGIFEEWAALRIQERLEFWESMLPGISTCERVELRGSSARVRKEGEPSKPATHALIRVSDPSKIALMKAYIGVEMVNRGLSFPFEKLSRSPKTKGRVVGIEHRGLFDLAVFDTGRLIFVAKPDISEAPGYVVDDAGITIVNEGGGALDLSFLTTPDPAALARYRETTGIALEIKASPSGGGLSVISTGQLRLSTEITRRGVTKPLSAWLDGMKPGDKLRCEAPFRESFSEAAFIRKQDDGTSFVYDVGNGTTYHLSDDWPDNPFNGGQQPDATAAAAADDPATIAPSATDSPAAPAAPSAAALLPKAPLPLKIRDVVTFVAEYTPADYLIDGLIQTGFLYSLTAPTGTGKTALALMLAQHVATGAALNDREVDEGNILFCAGENPDELRQRVIGIADHAFGAWGNNRMHVLTPQVRNGLLTPRGIAQITKYATSIGGVRLVIVDTASAFFMGQDENDNVAMGNYARDLRMRLCTLPGSPAVLVPAHPVKKPATVEDCLPRGGGAFLAEVDGNLALWRQDDVVQLQIAGKHRGTPFAPIPFRLETIETTSVRDRKGRPVQTVVARLVQPEEAENDAGQARRALETAILAFNRTGSFFGPRDVAIATGLMDAATPKREAEAAYAKAKRIIRKLVSDKLISMVGDRLTITAAGRKFAKRLINSGGADDEF